MTPTTAKINPAKSLCALRRSTCTSRWKSSSPAQEPPLPPPARRWRSRARGSEVSIFQRRHLAPALQTAPPRMIEQVQNINLPEPSRISENAAGRQKPVYGDLTIRLLRIEFIDRQQFTAPFIVRLEHDVVEIEQRNGDVFRSVGVREQPQGLPRR